MPDATWMVGMHKMYVKLGLLHHLSDIPVEGECCIRIGEPL
jgi:hypothetical protein